MPVVVVVVVAVVVVVVVVVGGVVVVVVVVVVIVVVVVVVVVFVIVVVESEHYICYHVLFRTLATNCIRTFYRNIMFFGCLLLIFTVPSFFFSFLLFSPRYKLAMSCRVRSHHLQQRFDGFIFSNSIFQNIFRRRQSVSNVHSIQ